MNHAIFKSYDVRGVYGTELLDEDAYRIGNATAQYLDAKTIVVGRDARISSSSLSERLIEGILDAGVDVIDLGLTMTPMLYFATRTLPVEGGIIVTASHNPAKYNGMKFCRADAIPIGKKSGLAEIARLADTEPFIAPIRGTRRMHDIIPDFHAATRAVARLDNVPTTIAIDTANAMGALDLPLWRSFPSLSVTALFEDLNGTFPNHEPNPLHEETLEALKDTVKRTGAALGIAYDGDGDRVGFLDERGAPVSGDLIIALLAKEMLPHAPGSAVVFDVRCSRVVPEIIREYGGIPIESPVGHSNIKALMREHHGLLGGEYSQHYYFRDWSYAEHSTIAALHIISLLQKGKSTMSALVESVRRYAHSGEINFSVTEPAADIIARIKDAYKDGEEIVIDGLKVCYPDWWFSVRASNTEPLVRLNIEATNEQDMLTRKEELAGLIKNHTRIPLR